MLWAEHFKKRGQSEQGREKKINDDMPENIKKNKEQEKTAEDDKIQT